MFAGITKDVRMPQGQFTGQMTDDVFDIEALLFLRQLGMKNNLKEDISQLFFHVRKIFFADRGSKFIRLLKEVLDKRWMGLSAIPGASLGGAELGHDGNQAVKRFHPA